MLLLIGLIACFIGGDALLEARDPDKDGAPWQLDCDDASVGVYPGAVEECDGVDNDCDGAIDEGLDAEGDWYADVDGDGYGDLDTPVAGCSAEGSADRAGDCDDRDANVSPTATDVHGDGVDQNCDGIDGVDGDGDGWPGNATGASADCDDEDPAIHPGATEECDGVDNDCDGDVDGDGAQGGVTWYADSDGDGFGDGDGTTVACDEPEGYTDDDSDCDDSDAAVYPGALEVCDDGIDQACDGEVEPYQQPCEDGLGCTQATGCYYDASDDAMCLCACDGKSYLRWEIGGVINDAKARGPFNRAPFTYRQDGVNRGSYSCGDEVSALSASVWPNGSETLYGDFELLLTIDCAADGNGEISDWYGRGSADLRAGSIIWLDTDGQTELKRWNFYETYVKAYSPAPGCTGTTTITLSFDIFEEA